MSLIGCSSRYLGSTRFHAPSKSPQRIAAEYAYCIWSSAPIWCLADAQPASSTTLVHRASQAARIQPFDFNIGFLPMDRGILPSAECDEARAEGGRIAAVGKRDARDEFGARLAALGQGGGERGPVRLRRCVGFRFQVPEQR